MTQFSEPFAWRIGSTQNGPIRLYLRAEVVVEFLTTWNEWIPTTCLVDTGASFPTIRTGLARTLGLTIPSELETIQVNSANGVVQDEARDGQLMIRFPQIPDRTFSLKWIFRDHQPAGVPPVLGLHNTIDLMKILFDGTPVPDAIMGRMVFDLRSD